MDKLEKIFDSVFGAVVAMFMFIGLVVAGIALKIHDFKDRIGR